MRIMVIFIHDISISSISTEMVFSVDYSITQHRNSNKRSVPLIYTFSRYRKAEKQKSRKREKEDSNADKHNSSRHLRGWGNSCYYMLNERQTVLNITLCC